MMNAWRKSGIAVVFKARTLAQRLRRIVAGVGGIRITSVGHVTIPVHDLDEARRFYCEILGGTFFGRIDNDFFRKVGRPLAGPDAQGVFHISVLFGGSTRVDLFQQNYGQPGPAQPHPHYAFRVRPRDLPKWKARLESQGIPCDGPLQLGPPGQASLYFTDPFGNHLELETMGFPGPIPIRPPDMARIVWTKKGLAPQQ